MRGGATPVLDRPRVLVVDDEVVVRRVLNDYLTKKGFTVTCVDSGEEAVEWVRTQPAGLVMLDIFMPGANGLEILRALKRESPSTPVVVISGFADEELEGKVKALGAVDCVRKPFDFATLHALVSRHCGGAAGART